MDGGSSALAIQALSVRYPGAARDALHDLSLGVEAGSFVSVAGRNGAGKSTLCLVAAGLLPLVIRADVRGSVASRTSVGLVLGDPAAGLTGARASVRDEVAFGLENLGVARGAMDERIDRALDAIGILHLADRAPETLSGGEQQRVAIAAAQAMAAPLLVLDEAAAELDPAGALALAGMLRALAADGTAVLAADHMRSLLRHSDRTVVLDDGAIVAIGAPTVALATLEVEGHPPGETWHPLRDVRPPSVEVRSVTYRYPNGIEALRDVRLAIEPGQSVAIVGANGSGKSTLAKLLVGLLRPSSGSVAMDGRDIAASPAEELARVAGFVFQDPRNQVFGRTVEAAVGFGPRNIGLSAPQVEALVANALHATGLDAQRAANPHDLDLAARKQTALAGALAMDPGLLILDEPTTGQDRPGLARVEAVLRGLRASGRTVVAITHDLDLAGRAFDRVVELRDGRIANG